MNTVTWFYSRLDPGSYKALVHYFGEEDVLFVQTLLQEMENDLCWSLGEPYYVNIFTHILIMMYRITRGNALPRKDENITSCDENIFSIASRMIQHIENALPTRCRKTKSGLFINTLSLPAW